MAIPTYEKVETQGSFGDSVETVEMSIDMSRKAFLMSMFTNLYNDPVLACVREYSTNAIDAQIENGYDGPVDITLPTRFNPHFVVRDYGVGMAYDDIRDTYSMYLASTKHGSNEQAGMFGIGSKSALAYGDTFTVVSVKDGRKVTCIISRIGGGKNKIEIVKNSQTGKSYTETTEASGTTIKIPVRDPYPFAQAADKFYKYLRSGKFLVDGVDRGMTFNGVKVDDDLYTLSYDRYSYGNTNSYIVMGNVPYKVETEDRRSFVKYVEVGAFTPTPPREGLEQFDGFKGKIDGIFKEISDAMAKSVSDEISKMSKADAAAHIYIKYNEIKQWCEVEDIEYKGTSLGTKLDCTNVRRLVSSNKVHDQKTLEYTLLNELTSFHIAGYDGKDELSDSTIKKCFNYPNSGRTTYVHINGRVPTFVAETSIAQWSTVKEYKAPTSYYGGRSGPTVHKAGDDWKVLKNVPTWYRYADAPSYGSMGNTKVVPAGDYDKSKHTLVYFSPTDVTSRTQHALLEALFSEDEVFLVVKNKNQFDKTVREYPEAIHLNAYGKILADKYIAKLGYKAFIKFGYSHEIFLKLNGDLFTQYKEAVDFKRATSEQENVVLAFGDTSKVLTHQSKYDMLVKKINTTYPLMGGTRDMKNNQKYVSAMDAFKEND